MTMTDREQRALEFLKGRFSACQRFKEHPADGAYRLEHSVRVGGLCVYHFVPCEPEDVVYQLDYNPEGWAHRAEYLQMFRDCGWEYLQDYLGYAYFRKPAAAMRGEEEEIFSDDASRLQMLRHVFRWRVIPLGLLLLLALVPLYVGALCDRAYGIAAGLGVLLLFCVYVVASFAAAYFRCKRGAEK